MIYECNDVVSPLLTGNDFDAKLMVVFLIQKKKKEKKKRISNKEFKATKGQINFVYY